MSRVAWPTRILVPAVACSLAFATATTAHAATAQTKLSAAVLDAVQVGKSTFPVSGTDVQRAADSLVVYTPASGTVTTTNVYGAEAVVVGGVVTALRDRLVTRAGGTAIPSNGVVLSGHGVARDWLLANARVGASVTLPGALTAADTVRVGSASYRISGVDVERAADAFVVYTSAAGAATPTNVWGAEAVVINGVVTSFVDRQVTKAGPTPIPSNGVVLSGHGAARDWLRLHARVGAPVSLPSRLTPVQAVSSVLVGSSSRQLNGTDVARGIDQLIRYTRAAGTVTPTNIYGTEAVVVNGVVTSVVNRQRTGAGPTPIPSDGIVLSGHGTSADWLVANARIGSPVVLAGAPAPAPVTSTPTVTAPAPVTSPSPAPVTSPPPVTAPAPTTGTTGTAPMAYPTKAVAVYHMMWSNSASPRLAATPANVNVVNLAFAQGTTPTLPGWGSQTEAEFVADAKALRARGVRIVLSVGGAGGAMEIANRSAFVAGVMAINAKVPLDGLDWDLEGPAMASSDVVAISAQLKELRGQAFAITMAPNGSNIREYLPIAQQLHAQGLLDMIGQQFYDAVVPASSARWAVGRMVSAGIPENKISIGMMVGSQDTYWTIEECLEAVRYITAAYPGVRSGYLWEAGRPGTADWADRVGGLLLG